jgi:hypothetical protein
MKTPEVDPNTKLADAVLADESWSKLSGSLRTEALDVLRAGSRARSVRTGLAQAACLAGLLSSLFFLSLGHKRATPATSHANNFTTMSQAVSPLPAKASDPTEAKPRYISEDQMLKMFPAGSCIVAEINGRQQLVFLERSQLDVSVAQ